MGRMRLWLFRISRWLPLLLGVVVPALSWARIGGGQHYRSGREHVSRSSPSGGGGDVGGIVFYLVALTVEHPGVMCPTLLVVAFLFYLYKRSRDPSASTQKAFEQREADLRTQVSARDVEGWVNTLKLKDPQFELAPFLDRAKRLFIDMQRAWQKRDLSSVRPHMSDATFQRLTVQLKLMQEQGIRDSLADIQVPDLQLIGLDQSEWFDTIRIRIKAQMRDVDVPANATESEALQAARSAPLESFTEVWSFVRKPGAQTKIGEDLYQGKCPNCGAPFRGGETNNCEFCKAVVNSGNYDWTLAQITQGIEHVRYYPTVDGLLEARKADPALNIEVLEDRVSLVFWKWIEAQSHRDARRLSKLCTTAYLASLDSELSGLAHQRRKKVFLECAVGGVIVRLFRPDTAGEYDEAHLEVRWSARMGIGPEGERPPALPTIPQRWMFVLVRKHGATTNTAHGMSTSRCPHCSAPLTDSLSATCDYCGAELASGERDWVLTSAQTIEAWNSREEDRFRAVAVKPGERPAEEVITDVRERERLIYMMAAMAAADGVIDEREKKLLQLCSQRWSVPWAKVEVALSAGPQLFDRLVPKGSSEAEVFLHSLVQMALVDGRIDKHELRMLESAALRLGIPDRLKEILGGK
jgi:tellurite resistance protein